MTRWTTSATEVDQFMTTRRQIDALQSKGQWVVTVKLQSGATITGQIVEEHISNNFGTGEPFAMLGTITLLDPPPPPNKSNGSSSKRITIDLLDIAQVI